MYVAITLKSEFQLSSCHLVIWCSFYGCMLKFTLYHPLGTYFIRSLKYAARSSVPSRPLVFYFQSASKVYTVFPTRAANAVPSLHQNRYRPTSPFYLMHFNTCRYSTLHNSNTITAHLSPAMPSTKTGLEDKLIYTLVRYHEIFLVCYL